MRTATTVLFFDFYSLSLMNYFAGTRSLNHHNKASRLENKFEEVTEKMYKEIHRALTYSVVREFRHFYMEAFWNSTSFQGVRITHLVDLSRKIEYVYECTEKLEKYRDGKLKNLKLAERVRDIYEGFRDIKWKKEYGGPLWAEATAFLLEKPKTINQKVLWIDRVLDHQHNNGHILNKTSFADISIHREFKKREHSNRQKRTALNHRRYATQISDFFDYCSTSVRKLCISNLNMLPAQIR